MAVRFEYLKFLLRDMENNGWIITSFRFKYLGISTVVVLRRYLETDRLPSPYAKMQIEFVPLNDFYYGLKGYLDFWKVTFDDVKEFYRFWNIREYYDGNAFENFAEALAPFIPQEAKSEYTDSIEREIVGGRLEGNDPRAIYCYEVRRNGTKADGSRKKRSIENSNKARVLRKWLYEKFGNDNSLSFCFSQDKDKEKTDKEIVLQFSQRERK